MSRTSTCRFCSLYSGVYPLITLTVAGVPLGVRRARGREGEGESGQSRNRYCVIRSNYAIAVNEQRCVTARRELATRGPLMLVNQRSSGPLLRSSGPLLYSTPTPSSSRTSIRAAIAAAIACGVRDEEVGDDTSTSKPNVTRWFPVVSGTDAPDTGHGFRPISAVDQRFDCRRVISWISTDLSFVSDLSVWRVCVTNDHITP